MHDHENGTPSGDRTPEPSVPRAASCGRWFCVWRSIEVGEDQPEALRWTVLRIVPNPEGGPVPFDFLEV